MSSIEHPGRGDHNGVAVEDEMQWRHDTNVIMEASLKAQTDRSRWVALRVGNLVHLEMAGKIIEAAVSSATALTG